MLYRCQLMKHCSTLYRLFQTYYSESFEPYGLGSGQFYFLDEIQHRPGVTMTELAEAGAYDAATVTRAIRRLCDSSYVCCVPDKTDHRVKRLWLTPEGERMAAVVDSKRHELFDKITVGFTEEELALTGALLDRLARNTRDAHDAARGRGSSPRMMAGE